MNDNKKYEAEIDFKSVLKNPLRLFGLIFPFFIFLFVVLGIFYIKNLNNISSNAQPVNYPAIDLSVKQIEMKKGGLKPAVDLETVSAPNDELLAIGKELYTNTCASCHGDAGDGNGVAGAGLNPKPRDFLSGENWTNGHDIGGMFKTLQEGILQNGMAAYEYIPVADRFAIMHYVRTFGDFYEEIKKEDIDKLDKKYNLSADVMVPNTVPVDKAVAGMLKERNSEIINKELSEKLNSLKEDEGYAVLLSLTDDPVNFVEVYKSVQDKKLQDLVYNNLETLKIKSDILHLTENDFDKLSAFIKKL